MSGPAEIAVITAIQEELAPLLARARSLVRVPMPEARAYRGTLSGWPVLLASAGDGPVRAERGLSAILRRSSIARVVGAGLAGALTPGIPSGTVLVARSVIDEGGAASFPDEAWTERILLAGGAFPARFVSVAKIAATREEKDRTRDRGPILPDAAGALPRALAVDLESAAWLRASSSPRTPVVLVRIVLDTSEEEIPTFVTQAQREDGSIDRGRIARHALRHPSCVGKLLSMRRRTRSCAERLAGFLEALLSRERPPG